METPIFIEKVADKITNLGLTAPVVLLLEAHKPLAFIGSQLLLVAQPVLDIFLPHNFTRSSADILANPDQLEQLIVRLEMSTIASPTPDSTIE